MRAYLVKAPYWFLFLLFGLPTGTAIGILVKMSGDTTTFSLVAGATVGILLGLTLPLVTRRQRLGQRRVLEQLPEADWKAAQVAARRGPVPQRPEVRTTALQLLDLQLDGLRRSHKPLIVIVGLNLLLAAVNVALGQPRFVFFAIFWVVFVALHWYHGRRLRQRRELLAGARAD